MNVYKVGIANAENPFYELIQTIHDVSAFGETQIIVGDFNARVSRQQFTDYGDLAAAPQSSSGEELPWLSGLHV